MISILTATYNREKFLEKLYQSLIENYKTYKDFEWIIIDDGSKDDTKKIVAKWIKESKFPIYYHYQNNQGKMAAINKGMKYVNGDIVIEMDSDDTFIPGMLKEVAKDFKKIENTNAYGLIYKRKLLSKDNYVNHELDNRILKLFALHNEYGYDFDMTIAFVSKIRKKYIYPLEKKEKFVTEARLYYQLDQNYDGLLFENKELITCDYYEDGYSKNINKIFKNNPYGYQKYFEECLSYCNSKTLFSKRIYFIKHYILFSYLTRKTKKECISNVDGFNKFLTVLLVVPGYLKSKRF